MCHPVLRVFQHTAARRRLADEQPEDRQPDSFNTQPPEGGWRINACPVYDTDAVSTHSRPKAAGGGVLRMSKTKEVSTHSRPKAAGWKLRRWRKLRESFNTQPPEGGWRHLSNQDNIHASFNTQPPEGGWSADGF